MAKGKPLKITTIFPGYHIKVVDPEIAEEDDLLETATLGVVKEVEQEEGPSQKVIFIPSESNYQKIPRGEGEFIPYEDAVAHEIAHAKLQHLSRESSRDLLQDSADNELEAWLAAESERRRLGYHKLQTPFIKVVSNQLALEFPEESTRSIVQAVDRSFRKFAGGRLSKSTKREMAKNVDEILGDFW